MRTPVLIDGRNALRHVTLPPTVRYYPIGKGLCLVLEEFRANLVGQASLRPDRGVSPVSPACGRSLLSAAETTKATH
jgi:hypothetical protein